MDYVFRCGLCNRPGAGRVHPWHQLGADASSGAYLAPSYPAYALLLPACSRHHLHAVQHHILLRWWSQSVSQSCIVSYLDKY